MIVKLSLGEIERARLVLRGGSIEEAGMHGSEGDACGAPHRGQRTQIPAHHIRPGGFL
jgi:hypothetical protein